MSSMMPFMGASMMGSASAAIATVAGLTERRTEKPVADLGATGAPKVTDFFAATRAVGRAMPPRATVFMVMAACIFAECLKRG